jgi:hypothetical protein
MPYKDLAARMVELRDKSVVLDLDKKAVDAELDVIRLKVVPVRFAADGLKSMNVEGVGRLGLTSDAYCTQKKEFQEELFSWLRDNDFGDMIKDTVNPSSLKSLVKELKAEEIESAPVFEPGKEDPLEEEKSKFEEISEYVNFIPFMRASVTKK